MKTLTTSVEKRENRSAADSVKSKFSIPKRIQGKLTVGQPNDHYEQEADRVADKVTRMSDPSIQRQPLEEEEEMLQPKLNGEQTPWVQRQEEEEEMVQAKQVDSGIPWIQTKPCSSCEEKIQASPHDSTSHILSGVQEHANTCSGTPLSTVSRNFFEPRFGQNFSQVRVHTCPTSAQLSTQLDAQAFTYGNNVFFNNGRYNPQTNSGKHLLAHELTHVVQQTSDSRLIQRYAHDTRTIMEIERQRREQERRRRTAPRFRVHTPNHPGWVDVQPTYILIPWGEAFELPHFIKVARLSQQNSHSNVLIDEGRYQDSDVNIPNSYLQPVSAPQPARSLRFEITEKPEDHPMNIWSGVLHYNGRTTATVTEAGNPPAIGTHDLEVPDYQHTAGAIYGNYATTWFRVGNSGDRYLHPGTLSLGCVTVHGNVWPEIWEYLINARQNNQNVVGRLEVIDSVG